MKILLHCCCAPCALSCVSSLRAQGIESELFWFNPNIHPCVEYNARLECLREFAANEKLNLRLIDEYGLRLFLKEVYGKIDETGSVPERCERCYSLRLEKTASVAAAQGFAAFSTSLLISPYQNHDALKRIGEEMAAKHGVDFYYTDFRPLFRESRTAAREMGLYMQKYCGCIFSEEERYARKSVMRRRALCEEERYVKKSLTQRRGGAEITEEREMGFLDKNLSQRRGGAEITEEREMGFLDKSLSQRR